MKASELRLGNWVRHNSEFCYRGENVHEFQWDESDWYALAECTMFIENIEPIPITEEWPIMLGLNQSKVELFRDYSIRIANINLEINIRDNTVCCWLNEKKINIEYIHQLQNLYFAITGNELKLKE